MRLRLSIGLLFSLGGCAAAPSRQQISSPLIAAERLIDAFYSFDPAQLRAAMSDAPSSQPKLLYYQGWAEGGNYAVLKRKPCHLASENEVSCDITVRDDLTAALRTGYWVTDTFHLTLEEGRIVKVRNSSDDPPDFDEAMKWLQRERPEIMTGPCKGFFAGGPTPQKCVMAVMDGFAAYRAANPPR
jgi:hypothetical protein